MSNILTGLVLAGGKSTRLGTDKVQLPVFGESLLCRAVNLLKSFCAEVYVSGRDPSMDKSVAAGGCGPVYWFPDKVQGLGPMGGILTGLERLKKPLLVMACDLPFMTRQTLGELVEAWDQRGEGAVMTTFLQTETGFIESLVAVYEPGAAEFLAKSVEEGMFKLSRSIPSERRHHIPYGPEEAAVFFNINYPADLAVLKRVVRQEAL